MSNENSVELPRTEARGVELLRLIQRIIIEEPKRFEIRLDQAVEGVRNANYNVYQGRRIVNKVLDFPACGTVACVAGWADILVNGKPNHTQGWTTVASEARRLLRITETESRSLFHLTNWPEPFRRRYLKANRIRRGKIAANYIEFFIANRRLLQGFMGRTAFNDAATAHFSK